MHVKKTAHTAEPLCLQALYAFLLVKRVEPVSGLEPETRALRKRCSTN